MAARKKAAKKPAKKAAKKKAPRRAAKPPAKKKPVKKKPAKKKPVKKKPAHKRPSSKKAAGTKSKKRGRSWEGENEHLAVRVEIQTGCFAVLDKESGLTWQMLPPPPVRVRTRGGVEELPLANIAGKSLKAKRSKAGVRAELTLKGAGLKLVFSLEGRELGIRLEPTSKGGPPFTEEIVYPGPFAFERAAGGYAVLPIKQGLIVPDIGVPEFDHPRGYVDQAMSFFGVVRPEGSMLAIVDTDTDWRIITRHAPGSTCMPCAWWRSSFGSLAYPREIRLSFAKGGAYLTQAKEYRRWADGKGRVKTLAEKAEENPNVEKLLGACRLTASICTHDTRRFKHEVWPFREAAAAVDHFRRRMGLENAEVHIDGWGARGYDNLHPDVLPPCADAGGAAGLEALGERVRSLGYLFGLHDQYWDTYYDAPSFDESLLILDKDGRPMRNNMWAGGLQAKMCAAKALDFLKRNWETGKTDYPRSRGLLELAKPTASYLDCFIMNYECHHPDHPLTRSQLRDAIGEILSYARSKNVVLSVEHAADWAVPLLDMVFWLPHLQKPIEGRDAASGYHGVPVPLFNLVYHDCLVVPARIGRSGDYLTYQESYLRELLYGSIPIFSLPLTEGVEPRVRKELFLSYMHSESGFDEMVEHKFLSEDYRIQRTTFASGITVLVDFEHKAYGVQGSEMFSTVGAVRVEP